MSNRWDNEKSWRTHNNNFSFNQWDCNQTVFGVKDQCCRRIGSETEDPWDPKAAQKASKNIYFVFEFLFVSETSNNFDLMIKLHSLVGLFQPSDEHKEEKLSQSSFWIGADGDPAGSWQQNLIESVWAAHFCSSIIAERPAAGHESVLQVTRVCADSTHRPRLRLHSMTEMHTKAPLSSDLLPSQAEKPH